MSFAAIPFYLLLAATFAMFWLLPTMKFRRRLLLISSFVFYAYWDWRFFFLLIGAASSDFLIAKIIDRCESERLRFNLMALSVTINLVILGFFKYFYFFVDSANLLLVKLGLTAWQHTIKIILPLGISFYTFETISYVVDVYRRKIPANQSALDYFLFVGFFPHLVAGPILRFTEIIPQFHRKKSLTFAGFADGILFIGFGLMMKIIVADTLGSVVDYIYGLEKVGGALAWSAVLAFGYQIYVDFWSYTLIARGAAKLFCIELPENFQQPYLSLNPIEFWRNWHISLSTWFRDYLYIPLGGKHRAIRNTLITMTVAGLWHGASAVFMLWGLYHGLLIVIFRAVKLPKPLSWLITFLMVQLGWILFRAQSVAEARKIFFGLFDFSSSLDPSLVPPVWLTIGGVSAAMAIDLLVRFMRKPAFCSHEVGNYLKLGFASAFVLVVAYLGESGATPFIYFNF